MKILMLTPYLPYPPHAGGRIRMLELLRFLQPRHEVTVASFVFKENEAPLVNELTTYCKQVITVMRHKESPQPDDIRPRLIAEYWTPEMRDRLLQINAENKFDLVDVEHIFMAQYAPMIDAPAILQEHNIESQVLRRYAETSMLQAEAQHGAVVLSGAFRDAQAEWLKMATYEASTWPKFPVRLTVSDLDRDEMLRICPSGRVVTVPNGVDTKTLLPIGSLHSLNVLFTGTLDYQPNIDAAFELCDLIWPLVHDRVPEARLFIVGRKPPEQLLTRQRPQQIEVIGDVPDIAPYAANCSVSAVPLRTGGGTRIKILTALALGLPVVTTSIGCEGLDLQSGRDVLVSDDPVEFSEFLIHLLQDQEARTSLARAGRALVEARYDWNLIFPTLEQVYNDIVG